MPEQLLSLEKQPAEKPFPWRCPKCRQPTVTRVTIPYRCQRTLGSRVVTVEVANLVVPRCSNCGEVVFDYAADEQIRAAFQTQFRLAETAMSEGRKLRLELGVTLEEQVRQTSTIAPIPLTDTPASMPKLLAEDGRERQHRLRLQRLLQIADGPVRIASGYVTDREFLIGGRTHDIRLITSLSPMDIASGATSLEALRALIESGVKCKFLPDRPKLHAKVYVFGTRTALVTSANLTGNGLDSNIEVGIEVGGETVEGLIEWYDRLWTIARPLRLPQLAELRQKAAPLRRDYLKLKTKSIRRLMLRTDQSAAAAFRDELLDLFECANQFFVCNTDRRHGKRTATGGYLLEEEMYSRGYATAWESFKFPGHMEQVQPGNAIFMFAKGVGIIGIGRAKAVYETKQPGDSHRVYNGDYENDVEWRVPVHWLDWRDQEDAYRWKAPNFTFWNVSDESYAELREDVRQHFLPG